MCILLSTMWKFILFWIPIVTAVSRPQLLNDDSEQLDRDAETNLDETSRSLTGNSYLLYTRQNPLVSETLVMNDITSITSSNFNGRLPTVVIVHGWLNRQDSDMNPTIRDAFLGQSNVNVIVMEWTRLASADYATAVAGVPDVGRELGEFLAYLNRIAGAQFHQMHIIGFGVGAHIVGNAGRHLGGRVARVTGLDPAGSLKKPDYSSLDAGDGIYVEAIHTNGAKKGFGIGSAIATADFFPNGGSSQPGCSTYHCSHNRAWALFASTVINNHLIGRRCNTTLQLKKNTCSGSELHMGNDILDKSGSGIYRMDTALSYPY